MEIAIVTTTCFIILNNCSFITRRYGVKDLPGMEGSGQKIETEDSSVPYRKEVILSSDPDFVNLIFGSQSIDEIFDFLVALSRKGKLFIRSVQFIPGEDRISGNSLLAGVKNAPIESNEDIGGELNPVPQPEDAPFVPGGCINSSARDNLERNSPVSGLSGLLAFFGQLSEGDRLLLLFGIFYFIYLVVLNSVCWLFFLILLFFVSLVGIAFPTRSLLFDHFAYHKYRDTRQIIKLLFIVRIDALTYNLRNSFSC